MTLIEDAIRSGIRKGLYGRAATSPKPTRPVRIHELRTEADDATMSVRARLEFQRRYALEQAALTAERVMGHDGEQAMLVANAIRALRTATFPRGTVAVNESDSTKEGP